PRESVLSKTYDSTLLGKFERFHARIKAMVKDQIFKNEIAPTIRVLARWKVSAPNVTDTGTYPGTSHLEYFEKKEWFRAAEPVLAALKLEPSYSEFGTALAEAVGK